MGSAHATLRSGPTVEPDRLDSAGEGAADYECPICLQALERPIRTQCGHIFCQACHERNFNINNKKCPLCRKTTSYMEQYATDIEKQMMIKKANCRGCDIQVCLIDMRVHTKTCSRYLEEYGPASDADSLPPPTPASHGSMEPDRHTYTCPYCHERNYDEEDFMVHYWAFHYNDPQRVVCPICASMPWGDPNYYSRNFMGHLRLRHQFQYEHFVDFTQDEEMMLQDTLLHSYQDFARFPV
ncbi:E3 ubiquitin-protein ligase RNF114-like [Cetorhinus maximus]